MRKIVIKKVPEGLGCDNDITILWDEKAVGVLKIDQEEISFDVSATERAVQAEIVDENGRSHRSNAYFVLNGKCPTLYLHVSAMNMKLATK